MITYFFCLFIYLIIQVITYLSYYCTGGPYPGIYYVLLITFIIYIIIVIIIINIVIGIIIITIIIMIVIIIIIVIFLCCHYLFLHRAPSSFCSPTTATFIFSWFLFFELICNYMGIAFF